MCLRFSSTNFNHPRKDNNSSKISGQCEKMSKKIRQNQDLPDHTDFRIRKLILDTMLDDQKRVDRKHIRIDARLPGKASRNFLDGYALFFSNPEYNMTRVDCWQQTC